MTSVLVQWLSGRDKTWKQHSTMNISITESHPVVSGVPTCLLKCEGSTLYTKSLAVIIPGNPGVADYYREYMSTLHKESGLPVWCLSHAGHGRLPTDSDPPDPVENIYGLTGQIQHKVQFIKEHIPKDTKLILMGHSIGSYIILHMLEMLESSHEVILCCMLFPTIERMAVSPQGKWATPALRYFRWMAPILLYIPCSLLPDSTVRRLLSWYFKDRNTGDSAVPATQKLADPWTVKRVLSMANEEMQQVVHPDHEIIEKHYDKLLFYYGSSDHWCPVEYFEEMKSRHEELDIRLCQHGYQHAFVLGDSIGVANLAATWIKEKCEKILC